MTMEHSQSQNPIQEKITSTSELNYSSPLANAVGHLQDTRYTHDLAQKVHDSQQAFGLNKYGITLDQVPDDKYDWQLMALEESVDMNQYLTREMRKLKEQLDHWRRYANAQTGRITKLNSQVEGLEEVQDNHMGEIEQLEEENRELKERVEHLQNYYDVHDPRGPIGPPGIVSVQKAKEMMSHGISD